MDDPSAALHALAGTLDRLEAAVAPLLAQPLNDTLNDLAPLERAKMDILVAYAINNLVWVYLRSRGIEPANHDVSKELERIQTYYGKVKAVENPSADSRPKLDREAAHRFVRHNLPNSRSLPSVPVKAGAEPPSSSAAATAASQAREATGSTDVAEVSAGLDFSRASRFRHIKGGGEKLLPGGGGGDAMDVDDEEGEGSDEAEALLEEIEFGLAEEEDAGTGEEEVSSSGSKRKRFDD